jgi:hypothetical protein
MIIDSTNRISVQTISPTFGRIRNEPLDELDELDDEPPEAAIRRMLGIT